MSQEQTDRIIALRESGCTQKQIAERFNIHQSAVSRILRRKLIYKSKDFASSAPYRLSQREVQVAKLLIAGKSLKTIADSLQIGIKTVDTHIATIYIKLGIDCRTDICKRTVAVLTLKDLI